MFYAIECMTMNIILRGFMTLLLLFLPPCGRQIYAFKHYSKCFNCKFYHQFGNNAQNNNNNHIKCKKFIQHGKKIKMFESNTDYVVEYDLYIPIDQARNSSDLCGKNARYFIHKYK